MKKKLRIFYFISFSLRCYNLYFQKTKAKLNKMVPPSWLQGGSTCKGSRQRRDWNTSQQHKDQASDNAGLAGSQERSLSWEKKTILESYTLYDASYTLLNWQHLCWRSREGSEGAVIQWGITRREVWSSGGSPGGKGRREVWSSGRPSVFWMWWWSHIYTWDRVP